MPKRLFFSLLILYIALGASWESTGIAIFVSKVYMHISLFTLNWLGVAQYVAVFSFSLFGYLLVKRINTFYCFVLAIILIILGFIFYIVQPLFWHLLVLYFFLGIALTLIKASLYILTQQSSNNSNSLSRNLNYFEAAFFLGPLFLYLLTIWITHHHPYLWRYIYLFPGILLIIAIITLAFNHRHLRAKLQLIDRDISYIKSFFVLLYRTPRRISVLLCIAFALTGILNVWTPLLIYYYLKSTSITLLISSLTFVALIAGRFICALLTHIVDDSKLAIILSSFLLLLLITCVILHNPIVVYLIPLLSFLLGPILILASAKLIYQQQQQRFLLCFWVLTISSLGDIIGVRLIGLSLNYLPMLLTYVVFAAITVIMLILQILSINPQPLHSQLKS